MLMTAITLPASLALTVAIASTALAQSTEPLAGPAISTAGSATAKPVVDAKDARGAKDGRDAASSQATSSRPATHDAGSSSPLVAQPVIRAATLIRPVSGTAAAGPTRPRLDIVDAGREDVGPLATSLRADPVDQRLPTGFDRVYRVPGSEALLMRGNGALFAVFDESVYRRSGAALPPGTVFHIGMPDLRPTEYGLGHPPSDTQIKATSAVGRTGAIGSGPLDLRVRPTPPGFTALGASDVDSRSSRAAFASITLESALGITPRESLESSQELIAEHPARAAGPSLGEGWDTTQDMRVTEDTDSSDPYAYLRLGPARIARGE